MQMDVHVFTDHVQFISKTLTNACTMQKAHSLMQNDARLKDSYSKL